METKRIFNKKLLKDKKIRQHSDGRISIFFTEGIELHTIYLKSADLDRNIEAKQIKQPQEMSEVSLYQWVYWEEV